MDQRGATGPSSCIIKKILRLEVPVNAYPNVCLSFPRLLHAVLWSVIHFFMCHLVQFCWAPSRTQG